MNQLGATTQKPNLTTWIFLAAVGAVAYVYRAELLRAFSAPRSAAGWYVKLYDYPKGHRDRELKFVEGPFATKQEAADLADDERAVWYPEVVRSATNPFDAE